MQHKRTVIADTGVAVYTRQDKIASRVNKDSRFKRRLRNRPCNYLKRMVEHAIVPRRVKHALD